MPIYRLLQNMPMGPEEVARLTTAYEETLRTIGLVDRATSSGPIGMFCNKR